VMLCLLRVFKQRQDIQSSTYWRKIVRPLRFVESVLRIMWSGIVQAQEMSFRLSIDSGFASFDCEDTAALPQACRMECWTLKVNILLRAHQCTRENDRGYP
jgi:hypothetical protein